MAFLKDVIEANKEVYALINSGKVNLSEYASADKDKLGKGGDRSLKIDKLLEDIFVRYLTKYGKILSEESGEIGNGDFDIILDPIDGSSNLSSNFPYYGSSVSLQKNRQNIFSVITNLCNGEYFYKDSSGFFRSNFLQESRVLKVEKSAVSTIGLFEKSSEIQSVKKFQDLEFKFRTPGAVALSLALAHDVNFVVFCGRQRDYDLAAGLHFCEDLYTFANNDTIIVSKEKDFFDSLKGALL